MVYTLHLERVQIAHCASTSIYRFGHTELPKENAATAGGGKKEMSNICRGMSAILTVMLFFASQGAASVIQKMPHRTNGSPTRKSGNAYASTRSGPQSLFVSVHFTPCLTKLPK